ncbi:hypothetical protein NJB1507_48890 [Mycobacterium marinum]|nr:hypothetical protein NJB1507_48890 [Mycobacterium marinum]
MCGQTYREWCRVYEPNGAPDAAPAPVASAAFAAEPATDRAMDLYTAPRLQMVEAVLARHREEPIVPVPELLSVTPMNYGPAEFQAARSWFAAGGLVPGGNCCLSLIDVGAGFGPAGLVFGSQGYRVTAIEMRADIAAVGRRVMAACGLQDFVHFEVADVMAYQPVTPADTLTSILCLLHVADKHAAMEKLATLLRVGGRGYLADFYARRRLSGSERALLQDQVACPGLLTRQEYVGALTAAGIAAVRFTDVTQEYSAYVHQRCVDYLGRSESDRHDELAQFFTAIDTLFGNGDAANSALGGCRIYLER